MGRIVPQYDPDDPVEDFTPLPFADSDGPQDDEPEEVPA